MRVTVRHNYEVAKRDLLNNICCVCSRKKNTTFNDAVVVNKDPKGNDLKRKILNDDYDASKEYLSREFRDEWNLIGLTGQVTMTKGQKTGDRWIKMRDISDTVEEWLVR